MPSIKFDNIFDVITDSKEEANQLKARADLMSTIRDVGIETELDYQGALGALEAILETASDTLDEPLNPLIELLSKAIEKYEAQDQELMAFVAESEDVRIKREVELKKTEDLPPHKIELINKRVNDPAHKDERGPVQAWKHFSKNSNNNLYAVICSQKQCVVGLIEVTLGVLPRPGWWIDSKFREKGYAKAAMRELAKLLVKSDVQEIGEVRYEGEKEKEREASEYLAIKLRKYFSQYRESETK